MRDPPRLEGLHLTPGAAHQIVGDLLVLHLVQRPAADVLVDQHHRVGAQLRGGDQLGRVRPGGDGRVREQRLLLQRLAQRLDRTPLGERPQRDPPPGPVEEALGLLFPVDDGDVQRRTVLQRDQVAPPPVALVGAVLVRGVLGAHRRDRAEAHVPQTRHQVLAGGADVRRADRVQRPVRHRPADQHGEDDRERGGVPADQHRERVEQQHHPQHHAPARPAGHPDRRHVRDDRREISVHRVGQTARRLRLGQRVLDGAGRGPRDPEVGGERHPVGEHGGEHPVRDAQPVAFDEAFDGEGDRHQQQGDAGHQAGDLDQQIGRLLGALGDVVLKAGGGALRERGDREQHADRGDADEQPHQIRGAVHPGGEQRLVAGDTVGQRGLGGGESRTGQMTGGGSRGAVGTGRTGGGTGGTGRRGGLGSTLRALPGIGGVRRLRWLHALLLRRLWFVFVFSYHRSPPA
ncbi:hypothetical protein P376_5982 [Streptomyces sp. HCCB10043]|nr:hypothetical protein P376_5982 [Streptomyces sp. HCCB10043]